MNNLVHLEIRNPKDDETPIEAATQIFASLVSELSDCSNGSTSALKFMPLSYFYTIKLYIFISLSRQVPRHLSAP